MISNSGYFNQSSIHIVNWPVHNVQAFTTTRYYPLNKNNSQAETLDIPYGNFNLGLHVGDVSENVLENRNCLVSLLTSPNSLESKIQWLEQVHGTDVANIIKHQAEPIIADAAITKQFNIALAIMTADCLPILLASESGDEIAAIHGGWRPLAGNIIQKTIDKMDTNVANIYAWLGPCIGRNAFEVGEEVKIAFKSIVENSQEYFQLSGKSNLASPKYFADLQGLATTQLHQLGVSSVSSLPHCTYSNPTQYYSYRKQSITGRMATIICRR